MASASNNGNSLFRAGFDETRLLSFLEGEWALERMVSDGSRFQGNASFSRLSDTALLLSESGKIKLPDQTVMTARRSWVWAQTSGDREGLNILVSYPQESGGRPYHALTFKRDGDQLSASGVHHCGDDVYTANYGIQENELSIDHTIRGPAKDLEVLARFYRY